jgi:hypothetical protein
MVFGNKPMGDRIAMSRNLIRFAGVMDFCEYAANLSKISRESGMDASLDVSYGLTYVERFENELPIEDRDKYSPLIWAATDFLLKSSC